MNLKTYPSDKVIIRWYCPKCHEVGEQPLTDIPEVGTAICECGDDMELSPFVQLLPLDYEDVPPETIARL